MLCSSKIISDKSKELCKALMVPVTSCLAVINETFAEVANRGSAVTSVFKLNLFSVLV